MRIPKGPGRNPVKRDQILKFLRGKIVSGAWKPGERIPPRTELERRFSASSVTVQQALTMMVDDGFIRVEGRRGTYVNEQLPHLCNYGFVFPDAPSKKFPRNSYFAIMEGEARRLDKEIDGNIIIYNNINDIHTSPEFYELLKDIEANRLAGIIFSTSPFQMEKTPVLEAPGIPRVAFTSGDVYPEVAKVALSGKNFVELATEYLVSRGRKRIAVFDTGGHANHREVALTDVIAKAGGECLPEWVLLNSHSTPSCAYSLTRLLMAKFNTERPDGLIIHDDNLTPHAQRALVDAGIAVPDEIELVSLCNFPSEIPDITPVKLIGYPIFEGLKTAVELIDAMRAGKEVPQKTFIGLESR